MDITETNAMESVSCLNAVFSCFDRVIDCHNAYKVHAANITPTSIFNTHTLITIQVETVGKVYMVVSGAPDENDTHAKDIAQGEKVEYDVLLRRRRNKVSIAVALSFLKETDKLKDTDGLEVEIRIGELGHRKIE